ncbi:MAG TPA: BON domain-containing protein [Burkholderiales bacterium]|nr:BON domain-containing protein [Burkholderiales bacterium]
MNPRELTARKVHAALEREPRVNLHRRPIRIHAQDGAVILEGEVADVAAKKLALEAAAAAEGVSGVVDRLRVDPGEARGDGAIRDSFARLLLEQAEFLNCTVRVRTNEKSAVLRKKEDGAGDIEISVTDGVILLEGRMISVPHRLFAGAVAWWTPGRRDVINALEVVPPYEERDEEVTEALRLALEADPLLEADQIRSQCRDWVVTLEGAVPTEEQRHRAELGAWSLSGVDKVINRLQVAPQR